MAWGEDLAFRDCPWCGVQLAQMIVLHKNTPAHKAGGANRLWAFVACPRCAGVTMLETNLGNQSPPKVLLAVPEDRRDAAKVDHLPNDVARFYADAQRVLDSDVPDAAAVQLRKTLEAAAAHFGIDNERTPLVARIRKLIDEGLITKEFSKALDQVRKLGNVGAHASNQTVDEASARKALKFTTQVLRNLFEIPAELAAMEDGSSSEQETDQ